MWKSLGISACFEVSVFGGASSFRMEKIKEKIGSLRWMLTTVFTLTEMSFLESLPSLAHVTVLCQDNEHILPLLKSTVSRGISCNLSFDYDASFSTVRFDCKEKTLAVNCSGDIISFEAISAAENLLSLEVSHGFSFDWFILVPQLTSLKAHCITSIPVDIVLPELLRSIELTY